MTTRKGNRIDDQICSELEAAGYEVRTLLLPACALGAPQRTDWRSRVFILAHPNGAEFGQLRREQREESREEAWRLYWQGLEPTVPRVSDGFPHRVDSISGSSNRRIHRKTKRWQENQALLAHATGPTEAIE